MRRMGCAERIPEAPAPRRAGRLAVDEGHVLAWREYGVPDGEPVLLLHGGPGSGLSPRLAALFDLARLRLVGFDQRGCGESTPRGETRGNDTQRLVADIERLRATLGIARWLVAGGSWGATLALAYAAAHREAVKGLLLRNLFVPDAATLSAFFAGLPPGDGEASLGELVRVFAGTDAQRQAAAAQAWAAREQMLSGLPATALAGPALEAAVDRCRIQAHYLASRCWLGADGLHAAARAVAGLPVEFVHGAADRICPVEAARRVHALLPGSRFTAVAEAGHDPFHPALAAAAQAAMTRLLAATQGLPA